MSLKSFIIKNKYPILIILLTLVFFWKILLNPTSYLYLEHYQSDLIEQHYVWNFYMHDSFQNFGYMPLWNNLVYAGIPYYGFSNAQALYPQTLLFLIFPVHILFGQLFIFNFLFAGLLLYFLMRILKIDEFSAFIAALIYIFNARTIAYIPAGYPNMMPMLLLTPAIFLFSELAIRKRNFFYGFLVSIAIAMQALGVHAQFLLYSYFFVFLYFLYRIIIIYKEKKNFGDIIRLTSIFLVIILVSLLLASIQLLPTLELSNYHSRSVGLEYEFASMGSYPFSYLITFINPTFFGSFIDDTYWGPYAYWGFVIYMGILALLLVLFSLFYKNKYSIFFIIMALLSLFLAFGKYTPLHFLFFKFVPGFSIFRSPFRIMFFFTFFFSVLAGFGMNYIIKALKSKKRLMVNITKLLIIFSLISIFFTAGIFLGKSQIIGYGTNTLEARYASSTLDLEPLDFYLDKIEPSFNWISYGFTVLSIMLVLITIAFYLRIKNKISMKTFKIFIVLILILDLWLYSMPYIQVKNPNEIFKESEIVNFLRTDDGHYRVFDMTDFPFALPQHIAGIYDIQIIGGYDAVQLRHYYEFIAKIGERKPIQSTRIPIIDVINPKMLDLLNVKYIITEEEFSDERYSLDFKQDDYNVYSNKESLPRAYVVPNAIVLKNKDEILETLSGQDFDNKEYIIIEEFGEWNLENKGTFKEAKVSYYSPHNIIVDIEMDNPGYLVLSETWYPGWKAYDNGEEIKLLRVNHVLRGAYIKEGEHQVKISYEPDHFRIGKIISLITLVLIILFFIYSVVRKKL